MHRMVSLVFKVLGISLVLMLALDLFTLVVDTINVNNKINTLAIVIRDEMSRNNSIPDRVISVFDQQINRIIENSSGAVGYRTNFYNDLTINGRTYSSVNEANARDYGELMHLVIQVEMAPRILFLGGLDNQNTTPLRIGSFSYTQDYVYEVTALRYLK